MFQQKKLEIEKNDLKMKKKKLAISIDMDDAWVGFRNENSFLSEAFTNIFDLFKNEKYKPTLFIIGKDINKNKENLKKAFSMGFDIGNHGYSHGYLDGLKNSEIKDEIYNTHVALKEFGPIKSFRASGWSTNTNVDKILVELGYEIDASRVKGFSFLILKIIHFIYARKVTKIYGRFSNLIFQNGLKMNNSLKYLILKAVFGIPFYHSMLKYLPNVINNFLIKVSKFSNNQSYIFHARDFSNTNINKTTSILSILSENYSLTSVRNFF